MMRRNSYIGLKEAELNLMMTEACGASYDDRGLWCYNYTMMEVGGVTSSMMKMRGATTSNSRGII